MGKVSIIIVNYNTSKLLDNCINSIYKNCINSNYEIIVVDNASDQTDIKEVEIKYKQVRFIYNKQNEGFGKANNIGSRVADGEYLLFLNSDTIVKNDIVEIFRLYYERNFKNIKLGCLGAWLYDENGNINSSCGHFPSKKEVINNYLNLIFKFNTKKIIGNSKESLDIKEVDYVVGALMFIKRKLFNEINGFDENFFMYYEETDLQYRLKQYGYKNIILNTPNVIHLEGKSPCITNNKRIIYTESMYKFFKKRSGKISYMIFKYITLFLRIPIFFKKEYTFKENIELYKKIIKV